jgi:hypothetical protein
MVRTLTLAMTILVLPWQLTLASGQTDPGGNAALKYWQAFATLPKFTDAENKKLGEALSTPLDDAARKILANAEYSLQMMHHGAAQSRCEWGMGHEEGIYTRLPQAEAARVLSSLISLRARSRCEAGQSAAAVDDIVAGMTLGRHSSLTGTNIMLLTGYAVEHQMIETLALCLPKLDARMIAELKKRLAALPSGMTPSEAMASEEQYFLDWFVGIVKKAKDKENLLALLAFVNQEPEVKPGGSPDRARAFVEECGGTPEGVLRRAEETRASYRHVAKILALPMNQFEKEFELEAKKQAGNPVFKVFFPAMVNVRRAQARMDVRRALLAAALAASQDGRAALKDYPDPVIGGDFEYVPMDGGFELRSKLKGRDDKPVTLTVGSHKS